VTNPKPDQKGEPEKRHYRIRRSLISTDFREEIIQDTINMYLRGEDMSESPLVKWGRMCLERGDPWWYGCEGKEGEELEEALQTRMRAVVELYHSIKKSGYRDTPISVYFDDTGQIKLYDGFHRISILSLLGMDPVLNVVIAIYDPDPELRGEGDQGAGNRDFPLADKLREINSGDFSYHPIDDPRVADFHIWRQDTPTRLDLILPHVTGKTVLDAGCSEGYFSRVLADRGFKVTALDYDPRRIAITRYLSIINNLDLDYITGNWEHEVRGRSWDTILMMSVIHHYLLTVGPDVVKEYLERLRGSCKRLILETPLTSKDVSWIDKPDAFKFTVESLGEYLEEALDMKLIRLFRIRGNNPLRDIEVEVKWMRRPIYIMEADA